MKCILRKAATILTIAAIASCQSQHTNIAKHSADNSNHSIDKPHILFISIDDFRPLLRSYGSHIAKTPNLDAIAQSGLIFNRAYTQQAICSVSRASLMTGLRPETLDVTHNYVKFRHKIKDVVTIPQHFIQNGYNATYVGKIFHQGDNDEELSWNWDPAVHLLPNGQKRPRQYGDPANNKIKQDNFEKMFAKYGEQARKGISRGPATEGADVPDNTFRDGYNTDLAIVTLRDMLARTNKPIFMGFGMHKPHLPWVAPKKYWDMYAAEDITFSRQSPAQDGATMGVHDSFEVRTFSDIPKDGPLPEDIKKRLMHAYLASVSYVDAQIGRIIKTYEDAGIMENTMIVVWSDHGYHLGEMGIWGKASNYEIATRVPLMISTPEMRKNNKPLESNALVELLDIYPTLTELAQIPTPNVLEGKSLIPLLDDPNTKWASAAFSQFPTPALREWGAYPLKPAMRETFFGPLIADVEKKIIEQQGKVWNRDLFENHLMGYSMRTKNYRLVTWEDTRKPDSSPIYVELFDHRSDPNETINIAGTNPDVVKRLIEENPHP